MAKKSETLQTVERGLSAECGRRIRDARILKGLRQEDLAHRIGAALPTIYGMERGTQQIRVSSLIMITQALDTPTAYFLEGLGKGVLSTPAEWGEDGARAMAGITDVARAMARIQDEGVRKIIRSLILKLADGVAPILEMENPISAGKCGDGGRYSGGMAGNSPVPAGECRDEGTSP